MEPMSPKTPNVTVHRSETLSRQKNFDFVIDDLTLPNGARNQYAWVRHPGSTAIIPITSDGQVVMVRQYRPVMRDYFLEIPAGTMEPREDPEICAHRELEEETGFKADELIKLGITHIIPAYTDEVVHLYIARGLHQTAQNLDGDEIITVETHPFPALLAQIADGRLTDGLTILALQRAWHYLRQEQSSA